MGRFSQVVLAFAALLLVVVIGCGGSGSGTSGSTTGGVQLLGNARIRAANVAQYQTLNGGIAYPFTVINLTAPKGSGIGGRSVQSILAASYPALHRISQGGPAAGSGQRKTLGSPVFIPTLNLYESFTDNGTNPYVINFYQDAAGTQSAGTVTFNVLSGATNLNYVTYPVSIGITINLTGGNLPCQGHLSLIFSGGSGANTLTGSFTLTKNNIVATLNMALDGQGNVSGTINIVESNATIQCTNLAGSLIGDITCNVTASPYGFTGTGTLNLLTGAFSAKFNTTAGGSSAIIDANGNLIITYPDASTETITSPITANLTNTGSTSTATTATGTTTTGTTSSTSTTSTGTTGSTTSTGTTGSTILYSQPVSYGGISIDGAASNGALVGHDSGGQVFYFSSYSGSPVALPAPFSSNGYTVRGVNASGMVIGLTNDVSPAPLYWASPTTMPIHMQLPSNATSVTPIAIADSGVVVGGGGTTPVVWSTGDSAPTLAPSTGGAVLGLSNLGQLAEVLYGGTSYQSYISQTPTGTPVAYDSGFSFGGFGVDGSVLGCQTNQGVVAAPIKYAYGSTTAIPLATSADIPFWRAIGSSQSGDILGNNVGLFQNKTAVVERGGKVYTLANVVPAISGAKTLEADFILPNGIVIFDALDSSNVKTYYFVSPK